MASRGTFSLKRDIVAVCRRLYDRGLIAGPDGNVSVRVAPDLARHSGRRRGRVQVEDLVKLSMTPRAHVVRSCAPHILAASMLGGDYATRQARFSCAINTTTVLPEVIGQMGWCRCRTLLRKWSSPIRLVFVEHAPPLANLRASDWARDHRAPHGNLEHSAYLSPQLQNREQPDPGAGRNVDSGAPARHAGNAIPDVPFRPRMSRGAPEGEA
jgi:hypothetical protein